MWLNKSSGCWLNNSKGALARDEDVDKVIQKGTKNLHYLTWPLVQNSIIKVKACGWISKRCESKDSKSEQQPSQRRQREERWQLRRWLIRPPSVSTIRADLAAVIVGGYCVSTHGRSNKCAPMVMPSWKYNNTLVAFIWFFFFSLKSAESMQEQWNSD